MRLCGKCGGSGWYGARTAFGNQPGGPCRVCNGSGHDQRWGERSCRGCSNMIEFRYDWSSVPEYCESCRQDQYKTCANVHCGGTIRYKKFWDKIPDYCQTCKGWYEKQCENSHCRGTIRAHASWNNVPKYCKSCNGWYEIACVGSCGNNIRIKCDWSNPPQLCDLCKRLSKDKMAKTRLANNGHPDHTSYSYDGLTRSFDSDKGENVRNDHIHPTGERGDSENRR